MNDLLHDDRCPTCRRVRRQRRAARVRTTAPWLALAVVIGLMAFGEWLTHLVAP